MKISVIIPVYNAEKFIHLCLEALMLQTYSEFEIIVIDNGSQDRTCKIIETYSNVRLYFQNDVQSSYAARNIGIQEATGELFAFTDADCIPDKDWLKNAATYFTEKKCDMLGGKIEFFYSETPSGAELLDSLINMQNHECIPNRGVAKTANLFTSKTIFQTIGDFPEVVSGGDVIFTGNAVKKGTTLLYADNVIVKHPTRTLGELLIKSWRTGSGTIAVEQANEKQIIIHLFKELIIVSLVPPNPIKWAKKVSSLPIKTNFLKGLSTTFSLYLVKIVSKLSAFITLLTQKKNSL